MSRRNADVEREAQQWIEDVTGEPFPSDFEESLKDGQILCSLINAIKPGSVPKVNKSRMPFKCMENISNFLKACRALGMKEFELFGTADLWDGKDIGQVGTMLHALGRCVQSNVPEFTGPKLGIKVVEKNERKWTEQQLREASAAVNVFNMGSSKMGMKMTQDVLEGKLGDGLKEGLPAGAAAPASAPAAAAPAPAAAAPAPAAAAPAPAASDAKPSTAAADGGLPDGWQEIKDGDTVYYYNQTTGETSWTKPGGSGEAAGAGDDGDWTEYPDEASGKSYYYNTKTGETSWTDPRKSAASGGGGGDDDGDWTEHPDEASGKSYFYNAKTGETSWTDPRKSAKDGAAAAATSSSSQWQTVTTDDNRTYYYNSTTGETSWEKPADA